jgi:hypothetical protein
MPATQMTETLRMDDIFTESLQPLLQEVRRATCAPSCTSRVRAVYLAGKAMRYDGARYSTPKVLGGDCVARVGATSFDTLRDWDGEQSRAFEEISFQLLKSKVPAGTRAIRTGNPDGRVEWYVTLADGTEWGWQAKHVHASTRS